MATFTERVYRQGRREYGLGAADAFQYAKDRLLVWLGNVIDHVEPDDLFEGLIVSLVDIETNEVVESLGGVDLDFQVSDHGNINFDQMNPYYVSIVAEMIREYEASIGLGDDDADARVKELVL